MRVATSEKDFKHKCAYVHPPSLDSFFRSALYILIWQNHLEPGSKKNSNEQCHFTFRIKIRKWRPVCFQFSVDLSIKIETFINLEARLSSTFVSVDLKKFKEIQCNLFYAYLWFMMLWNWFPSLLSFSSSNFWNFRIVNPYFWVWKSLNTTYRAGGHNFSEIFIYKNEIGITFDISTSIRLITTNHGKQVV